MAELVPNFYTPPKVWRGWLAFTQSLFTRRFPGLQPFQSPFLSGLGAA